MYVSPTRSYPIYSPCLRRYLMTLMVGGWCKISNLYLVPINTLLYSHFMFIYMHAYIQKWLFTPDAFPPPRVCLSACWARTRPVATRWLSHFALQGLRHPKMGKSNQKWQFCHNMLISHIRPTCLNSNVEPKHDSFQKDNKDIL